MRAGVPCHRYCRPFFHDTAGSISFALHLHQRGMARTLVAGMEDTEHPNVRKGLFSGSSGRHCRTTRKLDLTTMTGLQTTMATTLRAIHGWTAERLPQKPLRGHHASSFHLVRLNLDRSITIC